VSGDHEPRSQEGHAFPSSLRVLVVDDDPDAVELLTMALEREGYEVHAAGSCAEARAILVAHPLDALVTDISLPDGSGHDLARADSQGDHRLVRIAVSGYGRDVDIEQSMKAGFDKHLTKPVAMNDLVAALQAIVRARGTP
jgi:CheY-like chemotaxis protein